ncbi:uncharacterized protein LOC123202300 [Mangifera indica]|uniref:uncharacterized protein LOC123202300 n=1 Tax=Mangifera indica TaxID=29780 RepID=UPI001CFB96DA|nr:uncharacterized protein LOC123202300 [Mangifera indica]
MDRDRELEASFSFGGQEFSPATAGSCDEEDDDSDDQYIEIALERPVNGHNPDDGSNQSEFFISFSSSSSDPFLQLPNCGLACADTVDCIGTDLSDAVTASLSASSSATSASSLSLSSADTRRRTTEPNVKAQKTIKRRLLNSLLSNREASTEMVSKNRKETTNDGGVLMKFLIKCRSMNIRAILASFMKPYQFIYSSHHGNTTSSSGQKKMMNRTSQSLKKPFDMNLDAMRGVLEAVSSRLSSKDSKTKNSPSATKAISIQQGYQIENTSIQAAIAHCKRSFGQE